MCRLPRASLSSANPRLQPSDLRSEEIWTEGVVVSDPDSGLSIKSFHIPYCFIFHQEDYKLI